MNESDSIESTSNVSATDEENPVVDRNSNSEVGISSSPPGRSFAQVCGSVMFWEDQHMENVANQVFFQIVSQKTALSSSRRPIGGAWGMAQKSETVLPSGTRFQSDSEADGDEYSVPTYRMSMSDAIARAFANVNTGGGKFYAYFNFAE